MIEAQVIHTLGFTLLHFLWQGLLLGAVYGSGRWLLRSASPASRYGWALGALMLLALTPIMTFIHLLPSASNAPLAVPDSLRYTADTVSATSAAAGFDVGLLLPWVVTAWLLGVALMSFRLGLGWWYIHQLRRTADYAIPERCQRILDDMRHRLGVMQRAGLAMSERIHGPMLVGVFRPLVLMPASLATGLTPRQLEMVLAHELAHLKRFDHVINFLQTLTETLFFYQPVVRWVSRDIRVERELVSDQLAVATTGDRVAYAETLLALEKRRGDRLSLAISMADRQIAARVKRLLMSPRQQSGSVIASMATLVLVVASLSAGVGLHLQEEAEPQVETPATTSPATLDDAAIEDAMVGDDRITELATESLTEETPDTAVAEPVEPAGSAPLDDDGVQEEEVQLAALSDVSQTDTLGESSHLSDESPALSREAVENANTGTEGTEAERPLIDDTAGDEATEGVAEREEEEAVDTAVPLLALADVESDATAIPNNRPRPRDARMTEEATRESRPEPRIDGGEVIEQHAPHYPSMAKRQGLEGRVELSLTVDRNGRVSEVWIIEESPRGYGFGREAIRAAQQWRFEPFTRDGEPVPREIRTGFDFEEPTDCSRMTGSNIPRC
ncbi:M56 family metallopeptidase [Natronospira bacteriovora]|uniref:M56 family metallopeptidase n=1 Tax=Natronospira bacteriovora TaxID=3069753 RepID=A0ABU0W3T9_9GAMM|nr:M56 family metallopeptidase [Natronospira sp. AB-CW4]MDQ2068573.1 M56 family metallopeptidase [Natronospira sp. AB-CW4]